MRHRLTLKIMIRLHSIDPLFTISPILSESRAQMTDPPLISFVAIFRVIFARSNERNSFWRILDRFGLTWLFRYSCLIVCATKVLKSMLRRRTVLIETGKCQSKSVFLEFPLLSPFFTFYWYKAVERSILYGDAIISVTSIRFCFNARTYFSCFSFIGIP